MLLVGSIGSASCGNLSEIQNLQTLPKMNQNLQFSKIHMSYGASRGVLMVKNPPANAGDAGDLGSIPGSERFPGGGYGNPLQYSCLENLMDRGPWWATVYGSQKSQTQLKQLSTCMHAHVICILMAT